MSDEEKASVRLVKGQTEESHRFVIENRVKNTPNTEALNGKIKTG